jgi:hypothetical protein
MECLGACPRAGAAWKAAVRTQMALLRNGFSPALGPGGLLLYNIPLSAPGTDPADEQAVQRGAFP